MVAENGQQQDERKDWEPLTRLLGSSRREGRSYEAVFRLVHSPSLLSSEPLLFMSFSGPCSLPAFVSFFLLIFLLDVPSRFPSLSGGAHPAAGSGSIGESWLLTPLF